MTFLDACLYSLTGMLVVFFALVLLMCIIKIMTAIGDAAESRKKAVPAAVAGIPAPDVQGESFELKVTGPTAPGSAGELKLYDTDPRTAAMLMAIVADELKAPLNELRFLSIREIKEDSEK